MTKRVKKYCLWLVEETMKQVLGESEERYRTLVELAPDGIATLDMKGVVTSVNTALLRLTGFSEDEIVGKHFAKLGILRAREMPRYLKVFSYIARGKMPPSFQFVYRCKDGSMGWAEAHASFLKKDGKKVRVQAIIRDVTERKGLKDALKRHTEHLEELIEDRTRKLKESEGQYRLLLESISDSVYVLDREWRHVVVNDAATRFVRMPKEKLLGGKLTDLFPGVEKTTFFKTFKQVMKNRKPSIVTDEYLFKEGRRGWYEVHVYPVPEGILCISTDITGRKQLEKRLLESERLAAIGKVSTMVGHDLRNPLQSIEIVASYLKDELQHLYASTPISQETVKMLQLLSNSVDYADKIVRDLQDFASTNKLTVKKTDVNAIIKDALSQAKASEKVKLLTQLGHLPKIWADKDVLKRIFLNLTLNGIQAMEKGGILKVSTKKIKGFVEVSFEDTGVGIPKENMEKIFIPFFTTKAKGMGMGLAACKKFVEMHGGSIEVKSEEGKGSTFTVKLPIRQRREVKKTDEG